MKIGIVGYGVVGKALHRFFSRNGGNEVIVFDKYVDEHSYPERLELINHSDLVFISVWTPYDYRLNACDLSAVRDAVSRITAPMCIKSTILPGTVDDLTATTSKRIAFSPEYLGESQGHPWREVDSCGFLIVGGDPEVCRMVQIAYSASACSALRMHVTNARTAELCKYMENAYLAFKISFMNQFYDLANACGVNFDELRELFLCDERVGQSHTVVTKDRGFGGRCLPKDLLSLLSWSKQHSSAPLIDAVIRYNASVRGASSDTHTSVWMGDINVSQKPTI